MSVKALTAGLGLAALTATNGLAQQKTPPAQEPTSGEKMKTDQQLHLSTQASWVVSKGAVVKATIKEFHGNEDVITATYTRDKDGHFRGELTRAAPRNVGQDRTNDIHTDFIVNETTLKQVLDTTVEQQNLVGRYMDTPEKSAGPR